MIERTLKLPLKHSFFLIGARGTGKSTLLQSWLGQLGKVSTLQFDLLNPEMESMLAMRPQSLVDLVEGAAKPVEWVVIDEVQKVPKLLDVVHHLMEKKRIKFALTGSSARKLKRGGANLLMSEKRSKRSRW